jgi:hypothetical protein
VKLDTPDDGGSEGTARLGTVREIRERLGASVQLVAFLVETTRPRGGERA